MDLGKLRHTAYLSFLESKRCFIKQNVQYHRIVCIYRFSSQASISEYKPLDILSRTSHSGMIVAFQDFVLSSFTSESSPYSTKESQPEEDPSVAARLQRLQNNYEDFGMRRTVEGILVVHDHGHPHILMLQIANAFFKL